MPKFWQKRYVLRCDLNFTTMSQLRTCDGRVFHSAGAELENQRMAVLFRDLGIANRFWPDERRVRVGACRWCLVQMARLFESKCSVAQTFHLEGDLSSYRQPVKITQQINNMVIPCPDIVDNSCYLFCTCCGL